MLKVDDLISANTTSRNFTLWSRSDLFVPVFPIDAEGLRRKITAQRWALAPIGSNDASAAALSASPTIRMFVKVDFTTRSGPD
jgi:hypothetical protein